VAFPRDPVAIVITPMSSVKTTTLGRFGAMRGTTIWRSMQSILRRKLA